MTTSEQPTPSLAAQVTALLDQIEALIPGYKQPDAARARSVSVNARFAQELVTPTIAAIANYEPLRQHNLFDADRARRALQLRDEMRPLQQRIAAIAEALAYTIDSDLAEAGVEALQAYQWARHHIRHHEGDGLRPYVDEMASVVKRTIGRRKSKKNAAAPQGAMAELMKKAHAESDEKVTA